MSTIDILGILIVIMVGSVLGFFLAQLLTIRLSRARVRRMPHAAQAYPGPKREPKKMEIELAVSGLDMSQNSMRMERAAEAADGVPITVNNYYSREQSNDETAS